MITITKDIRGNDYSALIAEACRRYATFSVVWRDQLKFDDSALSLKTELRPFQHSRGHTDTWPSTQLLGHRAEVIRYSVVAVRTGVLLRPGSLFNWLAPQFPEDLAFYNSDGQCMIETVAHEDQATFYEDDWFKLLARTSNPRIETIHK